jgi:hypothetical protein
LTLVNDDATICKVLFECKIKTIANSNSITAFLSIVWRRKKGMHERKAKKNEQGNGEKKTKS